MATRHYPLFGLVELYNGTTFIGTALRLVGERTVETDAGSRWRLPTIDDGRTSPLDRMRGQPALVIE